jgi:hypothetical protein
VRLQQHRPISGRQFQSLGETTDGVWVRRATDASLQIRNTAAAQPGTLGQLFL